MSNSNKVSVDNINAELMKYLQEYEENIEENVKETSDKLTKAAANELGTISPKAGKTVTLRKENGANRQLPGSYASSWGVGSKSKKLYSEGQYAKVAYNKKFYRLTHLLEFGHANRNGSRTKAIPHIRSTEEKYKEKFVQELESKIRRGL